MYKANYRNTTNIIIFTHIKNACRIQILIELLIFCKRSHIKDYNENWIIKYVDNVISSKERRYDFFPAQLGRLSIYAFSKTRITIICYFIINQVKQYG